MKSLLLIGCGGHAASLIDLIETADEWHIHGLIGLPHQQGNRILGYPVIGVDSDLAALHHVCPVALLAIGQLPYPATRMRLASLLERLYFDCPVVISPHAVVSRHAQLGIGTTVGHGAILNAGVVVGNHCIINSRALLEHNVRVGDYCHVSTGAIINGDVSIGSGSFVGSGAMIREGLQLPASTIISAGKRVMGWPLL